MFKLGSFKSHSGLELSWKIDCDSLTDEDWDCIAHEVARQFTWGKVVGVPTGGLKFAAALEKHCDPESSITLIADDVLTTSGSMKEMRKRIEGPSHGVVLFSRTMNDVPVWITPVFQLWGL